MYYALSFPSVFNISNASCIMDSNLSCRYDNVRQLFIVTKTTNISLSSIAFTIKNFINPIYYNGSLLFSSLQGFSGTNYLINSYNGNLLQWQPKCNLPCMTCTSNSSACLSCYSNPNITKYIYYYPGQMTCLSMCYSTQILIGITCADCTNNCMECSLTTSNCTSCNTSTLYAYYYNFTCLNISSCPLYYYASSSFNCLACPNPCLACKNASSACVSCVNGTFLYKANCLSVCPSGITVPNILNKNCDLCDGVCGTCSGNVSNCTSCGTQAIKYNGKCLANCSSPLYRYLDSCVTNCVLPCKICQIYADYCLSC